MAMDCKSLETMGKDELRGINPIILDGDLSRIQDKKEDLVIKRGKQVVIL